MGNSPSRDRFQPISTPNPRTYPRSTAYQPYHVKYDRLAGASSATVDHCNSPYQQYRVAPIRDQNYPRHIEPRPSIDGDNWRVTMCSHGDPNCLGEYFNQAGQVYKMMSPEELARHEQQRQPEVDGVVEHQAESDVVEHMFEPINPTMVRDYPEPPPIRRQNMAQINSPGMGDHHVRGMREPTKYSLGGMLPPMNPLLMGP